MSGSLVRICSSTRIPPQLADLDPGHASRAWCRVARRARGSRGRPDRTCRTASTPSSEPSSDCSKPATPSSSATWTPWSSRKSSTMRAVLAVERRQDLIGQLDHRHVEAALDQVLRHLEADEPAADDDGAHRRPRDLEPGVLLHPGEEARPALDPLADLPRVRHRPHLEDPRAGRCRAAAGGSKPPRATARACRRTRWSPRRSRRPAAARSCPPARPRSPRSRSGNRPRTARGTPARSRPADPTRARSRPRRGTAARSSRTRRTARAPPSRSRPARRAGAGAPHTTRRRRRHRR